MPATIYHPELVKVHRKAPWSELPPEIWLAVFQLATFVPSSFHGPATVYSPPYKNERRMQRLHLKTRYRLPLVCKAWSKLATPFLYQSITITDVDSFAPLKDTLSASCERDEHPLGRYITSFNVSIERYANFSSIIRCMPNLRIFTFLLRQVRDIYVPVDLLAALCETCKGLEVYDVKPDQFKSLTIPGAEWDFFFKSLPNLRSFTSKLHQVFQPHVPSFTSDSLTHLHLLHYPHFAEATPNSLPALRSLTFDFTQMDDTKPDAFMVNSLMMYGPQLTTIVLRFRRRVLFDVEELNQAMEEFCPRLSTIIVVAFPMAAVEAISAIVFPPSVRVLAVRLTSKGLQLKNSEYKAFFACVAKVQAKNLNVLRFMDGRNVRDLRVKHGRVLKYGRAEVEARGWRLECEDGEML